MNMVRHLRPSPYELVLSRMQTPVPGFSVLRHTIARPSTHILKLGYALLRSSTLVPILYA